MRKDNLSAEHLTQLEEMVKANKAPKEIMEFFMTTYQINIAASKISVLRRKLGLKGGKRAGRPRVKKENAEVMLDDNLGSIIDIIVETRQAIKDIFSALRLELIKSRNEVFEMKKGISG